MFVIDFLQNAASDRLLVSPFHSGHLGLMPGTEMTATLPQSTHDGHGCEICVTPYQHPLDCLFRLKCILREQAGVVYRLLRAISALDINILSWESATLESKSGHGVYMLLDWGTTTRPRPISMPPNISNMFFPQLSGIVPPNDLRYLILLRQIMGQCGDVILWTSEFGDSSPALPRLALSNFDETRRAATLGDVRVHRPQEDKKAKLAGSGVVLEVSPRVLSETRIATGREGDSPLHYILLSDIESKTLRIFVPRRGRERRMIHLGFSHKNKPGALCGITKLIAHSGLSIISGLVRKKTDETNTLEATLEHEEQEVSFEALSQDPEAWATKHLRTELPEMAELLRYYEVFLESPLYPSRSGLEPLPLFDGMSPAPDFLEVVTSEEVEADLGRMKATLSGREYEQRRWLTDLLFDHSWGPGGKATAFLSYPRSAQVQAETIKAALRADFHIKDLQKGDAEKITQGAIRRISSCQYFIGIWHPETENSVDTSPWMPFEHGVAMGNQKPCTILCHENLADRIKDRIDRNSGKIFYKNLVGDREPLLELQRRCEKWATSHRRLTI